MFTKDIYELEQMFTKDIYDLNEYYLWNILQLQESRHWIPYMLVLHGTQEIPFGLMNPR